jgi:hypothetical protein
VLTIASFCLICQAQRFPPPPESSADGARHGRVCVFTMGAGAAAARLLPARLALFQFPTSPF